LERRHILRLLHKKITGGNIVRIAHEGVLSSESYEVIVYGVELDSLIVQYPTGLEVSRYKGLFKLAPKPWRDYCKWHSGPLDTRDKPWERIYCNIPVAGAGYCRQHRRSERYLYDICMGLHGDKALEACKRIDKLVRTEYAVYLIDFGAPKPKVGVTRLFRLRERIAEQEHLVATLLAVYDTAYQARLAEMKLSRVGLAIEHKRLHTIRGGLPSSLSRLYSYAEKAAKILGQAWDGRVFLIAGRRVDALAAPETIDEPMEPIGYWGGYVYVKIPSGEVLALSERRLLHRDSIVLKVEE